MRPTTYEAHLVEAGPGTPMGELMRRHWQPCFTSELLTSGQPRRLRLLGEDLLLFRDPQGRPVLVHEHGGPRDRARQPGYPVEERDGLVYAYMGPPERKPELPRRITPETRAPAPLWSTRLQPGRKPR